MLISDMDMLLVGPPLSMCKLVLKPCIRYGWDMEVGGGKVKVEPSNGHGPNQGEAGLNAIYRYFQSKLQFIGRTSTWIWFVSVFIDRLGAQWQPKQFFYEDFLTVKVISCTSLCVYVVPLTF